METRKIDDEIKRFLSGHNGMQYVVAVEAVNYSRLADCVIHPPGKEKKIIKVDFTPFIFVKNWSREGYKLYDYDTEKYFFDKAKLEHGITITSLLTKPENADNCLPYERLKEGYVFKIETTKSFNSIVSFFKKGGLDIWEKEEYGRKFKYLSLFSFLKPHEQFFVSTGIRLFKGIEEYGHLHKLVFDIETTGLRYQTSQILQIGIRENIKGFEKILEVEEEGNPEQERTIIKQFFSVIDFFKPDIISGHNSEDFDFKYILGRAKILELDITKLENKKGGTIPTTLSPDSEKHIERKPGQPLKVASNTNKYTATQMWGYNVTDTIHAAKRKKGIDSNLKNVKLKYICQYEKIAKENRTYVPHKHIYPYWIEGSIFVMNLKNNSYYEVPSEYQQEVKPLYDLQEKKDKISDDEYIIEKGTNRENLSTEVIKWLKNIMVTFKQADQEFKGNFIYIKGRDIIRKYLLDDLWETEQVDTLYNQTSFFLAKTLPTSFQRVCTMGTATMWDLLMTAWSYEKNIAIPYSIEKDDISGGLARCYYQGYCKNQFKIDFKGLYPSLELTFKIFPEFDFTNALERMLNHFTTERNRYKTLSKDKSLPEKDRNLYKVKQNPIKTFNNSQFGAYGSGLTFKWAYSVGAHMITAFGRLYLRYCTVWCKERGAIPLLAVTDGINFSLPETVTVDLDLNPLPEPKNPLEVWKHKEFVGIDAIIEKFNDEVLVGDHMNAENDGEYVSSINLARINYATKNKEGVIILKGNTIKSRTMPQYLEEFIDNSLTLLLDGKGKEFIEYYYGVMSDIFYKKIPIIKIATKKQYKSSIKEYLKRGNDKNGKEKNRQAHMELVIQDRNDKVKELYRKKHGELDDNYTMFSLYSEFEESIEPEPEIGTYIYYINTGTAISHGDVDTYTDENGDKRLKSKMISEELFEENPNLTGEYNYKRYVSNLNKRVAKLLVCFDPEIRKRLILKDPAKREYFTETELEMGAFPLDTVEGSMEMEPKEVVFWNRTGYDRTNIFEGIIENEKNPIYGYKIYNEKLEYMNKKMTESGHSKKIKSVNEQIEIGDLFLIKDWDKYNIYIKGKDYYGLKKMNIKIPLTLTEVEVNERNRIKEEEYRKLLSDQEKLKIVQELENKLGDDKTGVLILEYSDSVNEISNKQYDYLINKNTIQPKDKLKIVNHIIAFKENFGMNKTDRISNIEGGVQYFEQYVEMQEESAKMNSQVREQYEE